MNVKENPGVLFESIHNRWHWIYGVKIGNHKSAERLFSGIARSDQYAHQLIYVDDLIDGMYLAATDPKTIGQVFVVAGKEVLTTREMVDSVAECFGARVPRIHAPMLPFLAATVLFEKTLGPLGIQPPLHRRRLDFFHKNFFFSQEKVSTVLGISPKTNFRQGVAQTATWYKENGLL